MEALLGQLQGLFATCLGYTAQGLGMDFFWASGLVSECLLVAYLYPVLVVAPGVVVVAPRQLCRIACPQLPYSSVPKPKARDPKPLDLEPQNLCLGPRRKGAQRHARRMLEALKVILKNPAPRANDQD